MPINFKIGIFKCFDIMKTDREIFRILSLHTTPYDRVKYDLNELRPKLILVDTSGKNEGKR